MKTTIPNLKYAFYLLVRERGRRSAAVCGGFVLLGILLPFLGMALPSVVASVLTGQAGAVGALAVTFCYAGFLQIVRLAFGYLSEQKHKHLFLLRIGLGGKDFAQSCLEADGQFLESDQGQKALYEASNNFYAGTEQGIESFLDSFLQVLVNFGGLAVYSCIIGGQHPLLLLFLLAQAAPVIAMYIRAKGKSFRMFEENGQGWDALMYLRRETISAANGKDIRMYTMDRWLLRALDEAIERFVKVRVGEKRGFLEAELVEKILSLVRDILVYGYLIVQMAQGAISLSLFLLYAGAAAGFGGWLTGVFTALQGVLLNDGVMKRYRDFVEQGSVREEKTKPLVQKKDGRACEIRLENVSFRYGENKTDTICGLSLTISPGEKLALVGLNGAGKTTLVKLICGLYRPDTGKVFLDGQDLQNLSRKERFGQFAVVFQDVFAFSFPLQDNVSCAPEEETDFERLKDCLQKAGLWERVDAFPQKSKSMMNRDLDPEGVVLSGGEMQKLMLARALYKDAPVVILDEPTAALDPLAESELYEKYTELLRDKTGIFISHRLSSTRFCDRIILLEEGRIVEEGSHVALMEKRGAYAKLFETQAQYYQGEKG